jgi:fluoride exporter
MRMLLICLGGAAGTGLRYAAAVAGARWLGAEFPYATLCVNLAGSFFIGLVQQVALVAPMPETLRLVLVTGVLGGFTTYSAFSYETLYLIQTGAWARAAVNVLVTTAGCIALCGVGMAAGRALRGG